MVAAAHALRVLRDDAAGLRIGRRRDGRIARSRTVDSEGVVVAVPAAVVHATTEDPHGVGVHAAVVDHVTLWMMKHKNGK